MNKLVMTSGSFDLFHIGHAKYLAEAAKYATMLVVAVESDELVRMRKGPGRPIIPQEERLAIVQYHRDVHRAILKRPGEYIPDIYQPDVYVVSDDREKPEIPGVEVIVLPRMSQTSTSAIIRKTTINIIGEANG